MLSERDRSGASGSRRKQFNAESSGVVEKASDAPPRRRREPCGLRVKKLCAPVASCRLSEPEVDPKNFVV